jgi:hypothetical protein
MKSSRGMKGVSKFCLISPSEVSLFFTSHMSGNKNTHGSEKYELIFPHFLMLLNAGLLLIGDGAIVCCDKILSENFK